MSILIVTAPMLQSLALASAMRSPWCEEDRVKPMDTDTVQPTHDQVAQLAYRKFEERGRSDGHDRDDWFSAERELRRAPADVGDLLFALYQRPTA